MRNKMLFINVAFNYILMQFIHIIDFSFPLQCNTTLKQNLHTLSTFLVVLIKSDKNYIFKYVIQMMC